jgi:hypothetical protein
MARPFPLVLDALSEERGVKNLLKDLGVTGGFFFGLEAGGGEEGSVGCEEVIGGGEEGTVSRAMSTAYAIPKTESMASKRHAIYGIVGCRANCYRFYCCTRRTVRIVGELKMYRSQTRREN